MAAVLRRHGVPVVLVDIFPGALIEARAKGIPVLQAEILSEHGEASLAHRRVDYLFAATPDAVYNALVCARFAPELGRERVFQLPPESRQPHQRTDIGREARGKVAGRPPIEYDAFETRHQEGWHFVVSSGEGVQQAPEAVELLALGESGELNFVSVEGAASPPRGAVSQILVFAPPAPDMLPEPAG